MLQRVSYLNIIPFRFFLLCTTRMLFSASWWLWIGEKQTLQIQHEKRFKTCTIHKYMWGNIDLSKRLLLTNKKIISLQHRINIGIGNILLTLKKLKKKLKVYIFTSVDNKESRTEDQISSNKSQLNQKDPESFYSKDTR